MHQVPDKSVDMIYCDLPFGTTRSPWDSVIPLVPLWAHYRRIIKESGAILLFAQTPFDKILGCSNLDWLRYEWIYEKALATGHFNAKKMPMKAHENVLVFYNRLPTYNPQMSQGHKPMNTFRKKMQVANKSEVYGKGNRDTIGGGSTERYPRSVQLFSSDRQKTRLSGHQHSAQKPIALGKYFIETYTNPGDIVMDNAAGSMTTAIAAHDTGRGFICIDNNKVEFDKGLDRYNQHLLNTTKP